MHDNNCNHSDFKGKIVEIIQKVIDANNLSDDLYLIFDSDTKTFFVGRIGACTSTNQQGFEISRLLEPVNGSCFRINDNAVEIVTSILEYQYNVLGIC